MKQKIINIIFLLAAISGLAGCGGDKLEEKGFAVNSTAIDENDGDKTNGISNDSLAFRTESSKVLSGSMDSVSKNNLYTNLDTTSFSFFISKFNNKNPEKLPVYLLEKFLKWDFFVSGIEYFANKAVKKDNFWLVLIEKHCYAGGVCESTYMATINEDGELISFIEYSKNYSNLIEKELVESFFINDSSMIEQKYSYITKDESGNKISDSTSVQYFVISETGYIKDTTP